MCYPWVLTLNELIVFRRNQLLFLKVIVFLVLDITSVFAGRQPDDFLKLYAYQLLPHSTSLVFYWNVGLEQWKAYFLVSVYRGQQNVV